MFNTIKSATSIVAQMAYHYKEDRRCEKQAKARREEEMLYELYIAASQDHIGEYIPTPCPVQIWA